LLSGEYTIKETTAGDYEMTAKVNDLDTKVTGNRFAAAVNSNTRVDVLNTYPVPVTGAETQSAPYVLIVMLLTTAALLFVCRRKGEKQNDCSSL
jgi:LPXTG-motif cell wall-anchored protein